MNLILWPRDDEDRRDTGIGGALNELDPGRDDPTYWLGFHGRVLAESRGELLRRRREDERSVTGVISLWSRAVVPLALAAAVVAGLLLARPAVDQTSPLRMEDMLSLGLGNPIPAVVEEAELQPSGWLTASSPLER